MQKLIIEGNTPLHGTVRISGAKNAVLPILAACLLTDEESVIENVPDLRDVRTMLKILDSLGVTCGMADGRVTVRPAGYKKYTAPYELVSTMRASICVLGPILAKLGYAEVSHPGGCVIGPRPIDLHIKGLTALGAKIAIDHGYITAEAKRLRGKRIYLGGHFGSSVLATANVLMAATLAQGTTIIENAACEPEIIDLADFLIAMGGRITGAGTPHIEITGVKSLGGARHRVIPDRIEAGTYMMLAAATGSTISLKDARLDHLSALCDGLGQAGAKVSERNGLVTVKGNHRIKPVDVATHTYPGFPTDMQAQMMSVMCLSQGISVVTEKIYPERFIHISELNRMGARIKLEGSTAIVQGVKRLSGAPVMASDLRASAALVIAGAVAHGRTDIARVYHLDRGYDALEEKLIALGARVWREDE